MIGSKQLSDLKTGGFYISLYVKAADSYANEFYDNKLNVTFTILNSNDFETISDD